jgi:hypothetical protein
MHNPETSRKAFKRLNPHSHFSWFFVVYQATPNPKQSVECSSVVLYGDGSREFSHGLATAGTLSVVVSRAVLATSI